MVAAAVGPVTARPLQDAGFEPLVPDQGRLGSLGRTLVGHYEDLQTAAVCTAAGNRRLVGAVVTRGYRLAVT